MADALLFLNRVEAEAVDAFAARIMPGDATDPGAREAGVVAYIDGGLAGFFRDQQTFYREALRELDRLCEAAHGSRFADLSAEQQDALLRRLDAVWQGGADAAIAPLLGRLFALLREHTIQGMFCDPAYGGNRGEVGWRMVGFPGTQWGYEADQMQRGFDATAIPLVTLADLRERRSGR